MFLKKVIVGALLLAAVQVHAETGIVWNGFASFYGRQSLTDIYDNGHTDDDLNFSNNSRIGLNMRSELSRELAVVAQIVAAQRLGGETARWSPEFDWMFLNYSPLENLNFKFGRQLNPGSIIGEYIDVGLTYPWRRLPVPFQFMVQFKSFEGVSADYSMAIGKYNFNILGFGGNSHPSESNVSHYSYEIKDLQGVRIKLEGDDWELMAVGANYKYFGYTPSFTSGTAPTKSDSGASSRLMTVGGHFDNGKIVAYAEYSNVDCGGAGLPVCNGWAHYETLGYRIHNWLPYYTYSKGSFQAKVASPFAPAAISNPNTMFSHAGGVNYQVTPGLVVKSEFVWQKNESPGTLFMSGEGIARSYSVGVDLVF